MFFYITQTKWIWLVIKNFEGRKFYFFWALRLTQATFLCFCLNNVSYCFSFNFTLRVNCLGSSLNQESFVRIPILTGPRLSFLAHLLCGQWGRSPSSLEFSGSPVAQDGSPVVHDGNPLVQNGSRVVQDGSPLVQDGSPVVQDGSPLVHDGKLLWCLVISRGFSFWFLASLKLCLLCQLNSSFNKIIVALNYNHFNQEIHSHLVCHWCQNWKSHSFFKNIFLKIYLSWGLFFLMTVIWGWQQP